MKTLTLILLMLISVGAYAQTQDKPDLICHPNADGSYACQPTDRVVAPPELQIGHPKTTGFMMGGLIGVAAVNNSENEKYTIWCMDHPNGILRHADGKADTCADWLSKHAALVKRLNREKEKREKREKKRDEAKQ